MSKANRREIVAQLKEEYADLYERITAVRAALRAFGVNPDGIRTKGVRAAPSRGNGMRQVNAEVETEVVKVLAANGGEPMTMAEIYVKGHFGARSRGSVYDTVKLSNRVAYDPSRRPAVVQLAPVGK